LDNFSFFDLIFVAAIAASAIAGYIKGFVYQLIGLVGIIAGTYCAFKLSVVATQWLSERFQFNPDAAKIVIFAILAIAIYFIAFRLARLLDKMLKMAMLGWLNRLLGLLFGMLKAGAIFCALAYAVHSLNFTGLKSVDDDLKKSKVYPALVSTGEILFPYIYVSIYNEKERRKEKEKEKEKDKKPRSKTVFFRRSELRLQQFIRRHSPSSLFFSL
jgi:membrane protein required for colicin V production